jgi:hydroxyethylthiazole kinase
MVREDILIKEDAVMLKDLLALRGKLAKKRPLVHCVMHHIASNDAANAILSIGGSPCMAEHPKEAAPVAKDADALALNLGCLTTERVEALTLAARAAHEANVPSVLDLVGVAASPLRLHLAKELIGDAHPAIIKGNAAEIKALYLNEAKGRGVDTVSHWDITALARVARDLATRYHATILVSGKTDIVAGTGRIYAVDNGHQLMARLTGTGCMLMGIAAAYLAVGQALGAALLASASFSVAGELAGAEAKGPYSFRALLMDHLYALTDEELSAKANIQEITL